MKKTVDASNKFLNDLCRICSYKLNNDEQELCKSVDSPENKQNANILGLQTKSMHSSESQERDKIGSKFHEESLQSVLPNVLKNSKCVSQPQEGHTDKTMSYVERSFVIKHFSPKKGNRERLYISPFYFATNRQKVSSFPLT